MGHRVLSYWANVTQTERGAPRWVEFWRLISDLTPIKDGPTGHVHPDLVLVIFDSDKGGAVAMSVDFVPVCIAVVFGPGTTESFDGMLLFSTADFSAGLTSCQCQGYAIGSPC